MAVNVELWRRDIIEALFRNNAFLARGTNADEYVVGGRIVHIPQSGGPAPVTRNRSSVPVTAVKRSDTDITYVLDEYTTDPRLITDIDKKELSYDKRQSIIREDMGNLMEVVGDNMLYRWAENVPAGWKIAATGTAAAATAPSATGTRYTVTEADIRNAANLMNKNNIPRNNRVMILPSDTLNQLMSDNNLKYAFQQVIDLKEGSCGRLYSFDLYERSRVIITNTGGTVKLPEAAAAVTDNEAVLFFQEDMVERGLGDVTIFSNPMQAEYYGDLVSFLVRMGGRNRRTDNKGVGLIILNTP